LQPAEWAWLGRVAYARATGLQEELREQVAAGSGAEILLLLEHDPVITLGRGADPANVLASPQTLGAQSIPVLRTSRGGQVTFHGPGQIVGYPVFRLRRGVSAHMRCMADAVISVLQDFGIRAEWRASAPGVWVGADKICALGVHVRHRIAIHGFALNVGDDLGGFSHIIPCGLRGSGVTSIARQIGSAPELAYLAETLAGACERSFAMPLVRIACSSSRLQIANRNL